MGSSSWSGCPRLRNKLEFLRCCAFLAAGGVPRTKLVFLSNCISVRGVYGRREHRVEREKSGKQASTGIYSGRAPCSLCRGTGMVEAAPHVVIAPKVPRLLKTPYKPSSDIAVSTSRMVSFRGGWRQYRLWGVKQVGMATPGTGDSSQSVVCMTELGRGMQARGLEMATWGLKQQPRELGTATRENLKSELAETTHESGPNARIQCVIGDGLRSSGITRVIPHFFILARSATSSGQCVSAHLAINLFFNFNPSRTTIPIRDLRIPSALP